MNFNGKNIANSTMRKTILHKILYLCPENGKQRNDIENVVVVRVTHTPVFGTIARRNMDIDRKRILTIINPISGTGNKDRMPRLIDAVVDRDRYDVHIEFTQYPGHARELASKATAAGIDIVVAIGGDGTVNETASALCGTATALAIVPNGSGNGLARHLRVPANASRALQVLDNGRLLKLDYCTANGRPFFCVCGMGFDATVSQKFANEGTRGFITYIKTAIAEYMKYKPQHYRINIDGYEMDEKAFVVACCNAAQYGNNAFIAPRATMQDGLIDITVMHEFNFVDGPLLGVRLFSRTLLEDRHVTVYRGRRVVIERDRPGIMHIDGEPLEMPARVEIENVPGGINILVPPSMGDDV